MGRSAWAALRALCPWRRSRLARFEHASPAAREAMFVDAAVEAYCATAELAQLERRLLAQSPTAAARIDVIKDAAARAVSGVVMSKEEQ